MGVRVGGGQGWWGVRGWGWWIGLSQVKRSVYSLPNLILAFWRYIVFFTYLKCLFTCTEWHTIVTPFCGITGGEHFLQTLNWLQLYKGEFSDIGHSQLSTPGEVTACRLCTESVNRRITAAHRRTLSFTRSPQDHRGSTTQQSSSQSVTAIAVHL